jgi:hypothetical protein
MQKMRGLLPMTLFPLFYLIIVFNFHGGAVSLPMETIKICEQEAQKFASDKDKVWFATCVHTHE